MNSILRLERLVIGYGTHRVAGPLDASIEGGRLSTLVGSNGCGKSTLLRTLLGLAPALAGRIVREPAEGRSVGRAYVPQHAVFDDDLPLTVSEIISTGLEGSGAHRRDVTASALGEVALDGMERRRFGHLSGGQKQRVLVARALASNAGFIALDEPTAAVDPETAEMIWRCLTRIAKQSHRIVLVISHDLFSVARHSECNYVLDAQGLHLRGVTVAGLR